jgi:hypothetical protein
LQVFWEFTQTSPPTSKSGTTVRILLIFDLACLVVSVENPFINWSIVQIN